MQVSKISYLFYAFLSHTSILNFKKICERIEKKLNNCCKLNIFRLHNIITKNCNKNMYCIFNILLRY